MQFQWSDKYSVNVRRFDYQHHKILELFNEIAEKLESNPDFYEYDYLFEELREYSNYHFQSEEKILIELGFSLIEKHQIQHHNFLVKIDEFHEKFRKNNAFLSDDVYIFLKNWLDHHVQEVDKKYGEFLNAHNIF